MKQGPLFQYRYVASYACFRYGYLHYLSIDITEILLAVIIRYMFHTIFLLLKLGFLHLNLMFASDLHNDCCDHQVDYFLRCHNVFRTLL